MSHPDPLYDPDNSYEDDDMSLEHDPSDALLAEYLYDDHDDFYDGVDGDDRTNEYWPNLTTGGDDEDGWNEFDSWDEDYDDNMDGDHDSAMTSAGWGTDEDYGNYGDETSMYDDYYGGE